MDFISNLIKRPISLVRSDSLPSTPEPPETTARVERTTTPERQNQLIASALNDSLVAANIMDALNFCDEFRPLASATPPRTTSPLQQSLMQPFARALQTSTTSSNRSKSGSPIATNSTIEELLIQINDNLNMGDLEDDQRLANLSYPLSKPSSAIELNAICSKSPNVKVPSSPSAKEASPSSLKLSSMAPVAEITPAAVLNREHVDTTKCAVRHPTDENKVGKVIGLTEFDEVDIPELSTNLNLNATERVKLTFEEGLIPTLTADINEHTTNLMKDETFNRTPNQLVVSEPDTAASSDNETFAECQSYQEESINIDGNYMGFEHAIDSSQMDAYFSAANSRNVTMTNVEVDPLSLDQTPTEAGISHENIELIAKSAEKINEKEFDVISVNDSFGDEPMDVDMSISEFKQQTAGVLNSEGEKIDEKESVTTSPLNTDMPSSSGTQQDIEKLPTLDDKPKLGETLVDSEQIKNDIPLNKSAESPGKNPLNITVIQEYFDNGTTVTASEESSESTQYINISAHTNNTSALENGVEPEVIQLSTPNKPELTKTNTSSSAIEMNASSSSSKSSASSVNFPIKQNSSVMKQFPRSPTKAIEKEMPFLEKSEYTERIEIERKKSTTLPPPNLQKSLESNKTTSTDNYNNNIELCARSTDQSNILFKLEEQTPSNDIKEITSNIPIEDRAKNMLTDENRKCSTFGKQADDNLHHIANKINTPVDNNAPKIGTVEPGTSNSGQEVEIESKNENNDLDECTKEKRRTFVMTTANKISDIDECSEKRRTFNVDAAVLNDIETEPMDIDETLQTTTVTSLTNTTISPPISALQNRSRTETTLSTSPPIPTLQNRAGIESTFSTSPPIPTLQKDRQITNEFKMPESPPVPALQNQQPNGDAFKVPVVPTQLSPPASSALTRPPIHATNADVCKGAENSEVLSAKEQTKSVACDEKDVFVGNGTPSPMEEPTSPKGFAGFGNNANLNIDEQEFANADFQSHPNLILNPSDFDYLLTKGNNNAPIDRSSILLKFDPLLGVPVLANQVQQQPQHTSQGLQQILGDNLATLRSITEEGERSSTSFSSNGNNQSFVIDNKRRSVGLNSTSDNIKSRESLVKGSPEAASQSQKQQQHQNQAANTKKHASMSVDVIKDMNVDNDCNKSFENSNSQPDEKQMNYKMDELEKKIKNEVLKTEDIEKKLKEAEQREEALIKRITDKDKTITKMTGVIEAYEKAIAELIAEKEQLIQNYEKQLAEVKSDRDSNYQHLTSLETTFSDLHVKYEKSKEMTLQLKSNEESLLSEKRQILEHLRLQEQRYDKMKNHAMQQLEIANKKLESLNKEHSIETTKLKALLKKEEISRASINEQLQQKSRENAELVKICDELINGQGS